MIRRDAGDDWLLIPQIEHARLAGEIAEVWGNNRVEKPPEAELLIPAVCHHDDGWAEWERTPSIEPISGSPRDFTEMPMPVATSIWNRCIDSCANRSSLAGVWVSSHFCYLAARAEESRKEHPGDIAAISLFRSQQTTLQAELRESAVKETGDEALDRLIETGYRHLQLFDRISLWISMAERTEPRTIDICENLSFELVPITAGTFSIKPFALSVEKLDLSVEALRIPKLWLNSDLELRLAIEKACTERLCWSVIDSD